MTSQERVLLWSADAILLFLPFSELLLQSYPDRDPQRPIRHIIDHFGQRRTVDRVVRYVMGLCSVYMTLSCRIGGISSTVVGLLTVIKITHFVDVSKPFCVAVVGTVM